MEPADYGALKNALREFRSVSFWHALTKAEVPALRLAVEREVKRQRARRTNGFLAAAVATVLAAYAGAALGQPFWSVGAGVALLCVLGIAAWATRPLNPDAVVLRLYLKPLAEEAQLMRALLNLLERESVRRYGTQVESQRELLVGDFAQMMNLPD